MANAIRLTRKPMSAGEVIQIYKDASGDMYIRVEETFTGNIMFQHITCSDRGDLMLGVTFPENMVQVLDERRCL